MRASRIRFGPCTQSLSAALLVSASLVYHLRSCPQSLSATTLVPASLTYYLPCLTHDSGPCPQSLSAALGTVSAGTGEVCRVLEAATFRPRLPGGWVPPQWVGG
jgi:hypothetical protein